LGIELSDSVPQLQKRRQRYSGRTDKRPVLAL
jgi:hypothetical protein